VALCLALTATGITGGTTTAGAAPGAAAAAARTAPALTVSTVLGGLSHPWDIAFARNGDMYFTERLGRINRYAHGQRIVLGTPADVRPAGEGGMMGLALDPNFASNRLLYACFRSAAGGALDIRIARWQLNAGLTALGTRQDIVTGMPTNSTGRHSGCRIRFGPDGFLWVGTGDAATGTNPQNPQSLGGKVLRVTSTGTPAPGNAGPPWRPSIYNWGHRNIQGIAFSPGGRAYDIEHGTAANDEINLLVRRGNYGWDPVPGYDESTSMTDLRKFPNARRPVWRSGNKTIAPSGGTFLRGRQWGGWDVTLAVAVLKGQQLRVFALDTTGAHLDEAWARVTNRGRLRSAVQGVNGVLYIATDADPGAIIRVVPAGWSAGGGPA
jgi:glucose/arabinose dehydrogenase